MKIEYIDACINGTLLVDGVDFDTLTNEQKRQAAHKAIDAIKSSDMKAILMDAAEYNGFCECDGVKCEQCGDYTYHYTLNV